VSKPEAELRELYETKRPAIRRYLARLVGAVEAEDLTQEVFAKAHWGLAAFRGDAKTSTWLYRIATRCALDRLRSPAGREATLRATTGDSGADDASHDCAGPTPTAEAELARKAMSSCIDDLLSNLPDGYRSVLVLSHFEGLPDRDVAAVLGVSVGAAKIRLHRARERLRRDLVAHCGAVWLENNDFVPILRRGGVLVDRLE
jgi:RNA polymerase sigma-70 factor (ECF subfamily)